MIVKLILISLFALASCKQVDDILPFPTNDTTIAPPETTTPSTTTTTPSTTTTTASTTTASTTTPAATTTPATPTTTAAPLPPIPSPDAGSWNVTDKSTNVTCIILNMAIQFNITYDNGVNKNAYSVVNLPANVSSVTGGTCGNTTQSMIISWSSLDTTITDKNTLEIEFTENTTSKIYDLSTFKLNIYLDKINFPGANSSAPMIFDIVHSSELPSAPVSMSYRCTPAQTYNLTANSTVTFSKLQLQAFHENSDAKFGSAQDCQAQDSADIVPIAVGCALASLVVIVLVAYLIGRRRSHAAGYLSM